MRELSLAARGLLHALIELSDDEGLVDLTEKQIANDLGKDVRNITRLMAELYGVGAISTDEVNRICIRANGVSAGKTRAKTGYHHPDNSTNTDACFDQEDKKIRDNYNSLSHREPPARARSKPRANPTPSATPHEQIRPQRLKPGWRKKMFPDCPEPIPEAVNGIRILSLTMQCDERLGVGDVETRWPGFTRMIVDYLRQGVDPSLILGAMFQLGRRGTPNVDSVRYFRAVIDNAIRDVDGKRAPA